MLFTLDGPEFKRVSREKEAINEINYSKFSVLAGVIAQYWLTKIEPQKLTVLMFVMGRTLQFKKEAAQIYNFQFQKGVKRKEDDGIICVGTGLSHNTVRKHLSALVEDDFINAYRLVRNGVEGDAKLFEININKFFEPVVENGGVQVIPEPKKPRIPRSGEPVLGSTKNRYGGLPRIGNHNICINNGLDKSNLSPTSGEQSLSRLPVAKNKRVAPTRIRLESAADVVSAVAHIHEQKRMVRASAAETKSPWLLSKDEVQAVIDRTMLAYCPDEPRMIVTGKEYGFLKKRLKESAPKSFTEFIDWTIRYWHSVAKQNRNAAKKRGLNGMEEKSEALAMSPNFAQLVYRLPYFMKAYSNFLAERRSDAHEEAEDKQRKRLEARTAEAEKEAQALRNHLREKNAQKQRTPAPRITRSAVKAPVAPRNIDDALFAEDNFAEWSGPQSTGSKRHAKR